MKIVRNPSRKEFSVLYIDKINESIDELVRFLGKKFDLYVYFNKNSKINEYRYSILFPIVGYCSGKLNSSLGLHELFKCIKVTTSPYYGVYIPVSYSLLEVNRECHGLEKALLRGVLCSSIINSHDIPFDELSDVYSNSVLKLLGYNKDLGVNSTKRTDSGMFLMNNDLCQILEKFDDNKYLKSFRKSEVSDLIPSTFENLGMKFINSKIEEL